MTVAERVNLRVKSGKMGSGKVGSGKMGGNHDGMDNPFLCTLLIAVHYAIYSFSDAYIVKTVTLEHQRLIIHHHL